MTTQSPDLLRHEGAEYGIKPFPLESLGSSWSRIECVNGSTSLRFAWRSTACRRGYVANWEIVHNRLFLVGFSANDINNNPLTMQDIFATDRLFAFWYTGAVRSSFGERIYGLYEPTMRFDHVWNFDFGILTSRTLRDNDKHENRGRQRSL